MTHSTFHFAFGAILGMVLCGPGWARAWHGRLPLFRPLVTLLVTSWGLGFVAVFPSILAHVGFPREYLEQAWANVFCFYPVIHALGHRGGSYLGPLAILLVMSSQYLLICVAIARTRQA